MAELDVVDLTQDAPQAPVWKWLESTLVLQRDYYGHDWAKIRAQGDRAYGEALAQSTMENGLSLVCELVEYLGEVGWKPWTSPRGWVNRDAALKEAVDKLHFIANLLVSIGVTDDELWEAYRAKQEVNRQRQVEGYDGVSSKCPVCHRDYTERDGSARYTDVGCSMVVAAGIQHFMCQASRASAAQS